MSSAWDRIWGRCKLDGYVMIKYVRGLLWVVGLVGTMAWSTQLFTQDSSMSQRDIQPLEAPHDVVAGDSKAQLVRIGQHLEFFAGIANGNTDDIADWVLGSGRNVAWVSRFSNHLLTQKDLIKNDIRNHLKKFPFLSIEAKICSQSLQQILRDMQEKNDFSGLITYWEALSDFFDHGDSALLFDDAFAADLKTAPLIGLQNHRMLCALAGLKDLSCITYLFHTYFAGICARQCTTARGSFWSNFIPSQDNGLMNLLYAYHTVDKLPVENVISAIDRFIEDFAQALKKLQADANPVDGESNNADGNFAEWLKEKWVLMPLAVGVIIVKTVYYFWAKEKEKDGIHIPFMNGVAFSL